MDIIQLGKLAKAIVNAFIFLKTLTKDYGLPVNLSEEAFHKILKDIENQPLVFNRFALVLNTKLNEIIWQYNFNKFLKFGKSAAIVSKSSI